MPVSHPSVHPVEAPPSPLADGRNEPLRPRMKDIQGMPGTVIDVILRFSQFVFAAAALCVMATTSDFSSVTAFRYLVAAVGIQSLWSLSLAIADIYALLVGRCLQNNNIIVGLFATGDGITSTLTYAAACGSAGITLLLSRDLDLCYMNHCIQFQTATAMAFLCWFTAFLSFILNSWFFVSRT
ncbi:CASP-like protein 5A2 [Impatiens glandulifera]|uniref:CASP-like protein 5A2 n=1 Tax=Impatiens glandulifera TaxID=253017 RepID=UPI001FB115A0|nr:CASP-like protein 5A2 [Impatiens glandulifera]